MGEDKNGFPIILNMKVSIDAELNLHCSCDLNTKIFNENLVYQHMQDFVDELCESGNGEDE